MWKPMDQSLVLPRGKRVYPLGKRNSVSRTAGKRTVHAPWISNLEFMYIDRQLICDVNLLKRGN